MRNPFRRRRRPVSVRVSATGPVRVRAYTTRPGEKPQAWQWDPDTGRMQPVELTDAHVADLEEHQRKADEVVTSSADLAAQASALAARFPAGTTVTIVTDTEKGSS